MIIKVEFEGTDGAGKTTGLKYFIEKARTLGITVTETREVGNPNIPACVKLREFVLDPNSNLSGEAMEFIFAAMRYENDRWLQTLQAEDGHNDSHLVVSDRGYLSHLSYTDHNVSRTFTRALYSGVVEKQTSLPDVVLYFKVNTDTALQRRVKRGTGMDVIEMKGIEFQNKVRDSFDRYIEELSETTGIQFVVIDANQDIAGVQAQLDKVLEALSTRLTDFSA